MELVLVGFNHKSAPIGARERLALLGVPGLLERLRAEGCREAVALSTCNRFELYLPSDGRPSIAAARAISVIEELSAVPLAAHAYVHSGLPAVEHLFSVAAGLDSLVVGETEVLGQVRAAYESAKALGMTGKHANVLFQRALYVGKKARSDTAIAVGQTSVASVAVQLAESIFGSLAGSEVLILGAGAMAELTAQHLLSSKVAKLSIANRTWERAAALAAKIRAQPLRWERFPEAIRRCDIVVASTGSQAPVLTREMVASALRGRAGRSLFLIDIAMPRDVEESVHGLEHVYLYRLEDLEGIVAENLKNRGGEVAKADAIVKAKAAEFRAWQDSVANGSEISLKHSQAAL
jgi:glutamyl-tRNA reductase